MQRKEGHMHKTILKASSLRLPRRRDHRDAAAAPVHFHQGPQHQPVPCYDERCSSPRLSL
jgi:hypothetical protein